MGARAPAGPGEPGGAGPGAGPLTIDLDSTICETYGLAKEGARRHNYAGQWGYHPLLAIAVAALTSCGRRWDGCATPEPLDHSLCGLTAASTPTVSSPSAAR